MAAPDPLLWVHFHTLESPKLKLPAYKWGCGWPAFISFSSLETSEGFGQPPIAVDGETMTQRRATTTIMRLFIVDCVRNELSVNETCGMGLYRKAFLLTYFCGAYRFQSIFYRIVSDTETESSLKYFSLVIFENINRVVFYEMCWRFDYVNRNIM